MGISHEVSKALCANGPLQSSSQFQMGIKTNALSNTLLQCSERRTHSSASERPMRYPILIREPAIIKIRKSTSEQIDSDIHSPI
jgi:hypothetical protein